MYTELRIRIMDVKYMQDLTGNVKQRVFGPRTSEHQSLKQSNLQNKDVIHNS